MEKEIFVLGLHQISFVVMDIKCCEWAFINAKTGAELLKRIGLICMLFYHLKFIDSNSIEIQFSELLTSKSEIENSLPKILKIHKKKCVFMFYVCLLCQTS